MKPRCAVAAILAAVAFATGCDAGAKAPPEPPSSPKCSTTLSFPHGLDQCVAFEATECQSDIDCAPGRKACFAAVDSTCSKKAGGACLPAKTRFRAECVRGCCEGGRY